LGTAQVPSLSYQAEVIRGVSEEAQRHNLLVSLFPLLDDGEATVQRAVRLFRPAGAVFVRTAPTPETQHFLQRQGVACVLVQADREDYGPPVLANVVPAQQAISTSLRMWTECQLQRKAPGAGAGKRFGVDAIVVVRMEREGPNSVRSQRIDQVLEGLGAYPLIHDEVVLGYGFNHALPVFQKYPRARAYVCLSDELAVAFKHLLRAAGQDATGRVIGFDDSELARSEQIPSFGQHTVDLGRNASRVIADWLTADDHKHWPKAREVPVEVYWLQRG
jgi:DNA-binding LacI/PurR family transcriptional regulator